MSVFKTTHIDSRDKWIPWTDQWNDLVQHRPMRSMAWLLEWWDQFQSSTKKLRIYLFESDGQLVGAAPLYESRIGGRTVIRLLGDAGDICTDHTTFFSRPDFSESVGLEAARRLLQDNSWHRLHWDDVDTAEPAMAAAIEAIRAQDCLLHFTPRDSCWSFDLPNSWDAYLQLLSKNRRKRCRKWLRKYFDSGRVLIQSATPDDPTWDACWQTLLSLHAQRWGSSRRPAGSFSGQRFTAFHEIVSQRLARQGQIRLCYLTVDGEPAAAEYQLLDHDTLYCYQSGMSEAHQDVGPGNLSLIATIQYAIDQGLHRLDFLRGNEPYKAQWLGEPSRRASLRVWRQGLQGQLELGYQWARRRAAVWLGR